MATEPIINQPEEETGEAGFFDFAATLPETAEGFLAGELIPPSSPQGSGESSQDGGEQSAVPPERKKVNVSKKVRRAMNKFKTKAADVPIMWFHQQAKNNPEWELDKDEQELLKDSIDTVFDVLDIEVEIQPLSWTLTSIWWVVSYPILAFVFLFLTKKSMTMEKERSEAEAAE